ncbi:hypothetical protein D3C73_1273110 [compost metagenome]
MASAPQKVTRQAPVMTLAPPALAAMAPNVPRNTNDMPDTQGTTPCSGATNVTPSGNAAPTTKLAAEAKAACKGLAVRVALIPNSSRAWEPSASWAIN